MGITWKRLENILFHCSSYESEASYHDAGKTKKNCGQNGESVFVSDEFIRMAELGEDVDHLPDWQQHEIKK
ncbi:MAG TPA: hypothetical protein VKZ77_04015 [Bacillaceae bacterium]|nr:hypothetical protein [Bacillaceae bacterium]